MAKIIETSEFNPEKVSTQEVLWIYNGLDCCVTREVFDALNRQLDNAPERIVYDFERGLMAPALDMMLRGIRIDPLARYNETVRLISRQERLEKILNRIAREVWGKDLNPRSPAQVLEFLFKRLNIPEIWTRQKGKKILSSNRETLEKAQDYFIARPVCSLILACREHSKKISVLKTGIDEDGRMRTSYNVGATETGRWSSSENAFGKGTNQQNWTNENRVIFIPDKGMKFGNVDLEQAESRVVAYEAADEAYIHACESGDLHTTSAMLIWPEMFKGVAPDKLREVAETPFYRHFSFRDMSKRGGHAYNYNATAWTVSRHLKIELKIAEQFREKYFQAFPGIPRWHSAIATELQTTGILTTALGRKRHFLGRLYDDATIREAIAYRPQSTVGDILNIALFRLWKHAKELNIQLLAQVHDSILFQYPEEQEAEIIARVLTMMRVTVNIKGRSLVIPAGCETGWNWMKASKTNPHGLSKWKGKDDRTRPLEPSTSLLDRRIS